MLTVPPAKAVSVSFTVPEVARLKTALNTGRRGVARRVGAAREPVVVTRDPSAPAREKQQRRPGPDGAVNPAERGGRCRHGSGRNRGADRARRATSVPGGHLAAQLMPGVGSRDHVRLRALTGDRCTVELPLKGEARRAVRPRPVGARQHRAHRGGAGDRGKRGVGGRRRRCRRPGSHLPDTIRLELCEPQVSRAVLGVRGGVPGDSLRRRERLGPVGPGIEPEQRLAGVIGRPDAAIPGVRQPQRLAYGWELGDPLIGVGCYNARVDHGKVPGAVLGDVQIAAGPGRDPFRLGAGAGAREVV